MKPQTPPQHQHMNTKNRIAYFGISKSNRIHFDKEIEAIRRCLKQHQCELQVFVDTYDFSLGQEHEMMRIAFEDIQNCDLLIVEVSKKAIGVGVEVGYAKALNKPIIYLRRSSSTYSTTVGGAADYAIEYEDAIQLQQELDRIMRLNVT